MPLSGIVGDKCSHRQCHQNSGQDPAHKASPDGGTYRNRKNHHRQGRRNDRPENGRRGRHRAGKVIIIAEVAHSLNFNIAQATGICHCRAGHACKHCRAEDIGMPHPAGYGPHQRVGKAEELTRNTAGIHEIPHQDEERRCNHREGVGRLGNTLQHDDRLHPRHKDVEE